VYLEQQLGKVDLGEQGGGVSAKAPGAGRLGEAVEVGDVDAVALAVLVDPRRRVLLHRLRGLEVGSVEFGPEALDVRRRPWGQCERPQDLGAGPLPDLGGDEKATRVAPPVRADDVDVAPTKGQAEAVEDAQRVGTAIDGALCDHERTPPVGDHRRRWRRGRRPGLDRSQVVEGGQHGMPGGDGGEADAAQERGQETPDVRVAGQETLLRLVRAHPEQLAHHDGGSLELVAADQAEDRRADVRIHDVGIQDDERGLA
jgi:hypothetical protein